MGVVEASKGVAADIRRNLGAIKERLLVKLSAASVPADALDNARHFLENRVRDVTLAARGLTKDALHRIKTHLVDILPSLSPSITRKMVDEAEKEANGDQTESEREEERADHDHDHLHQQPSTGKAPYVSPASSLFASLVNKPFSLKRKAEIIEGLEDSDTGDEQDDEAFDNRKEETLSTHEKELEKVRSKIEQMENANLEPKDWIMQGEVTAAKRPKNSALEVDLDFEHNVRPAPVITEEVTASISLRGGLMMF